MLLRDLAPAMFLQRVWATLEDLYHSALKFKSSDTAYHFVLEQDDITSFKLAPPVIPPNRTEFYGIYSPTYPFLPTPTSIPDVLGPAPGLRPTLPLQTPHVANSLPTDIALFSNAEPLTSYTSLQTLSDHAVPSLVLNSYLSTNAALVCIILLLVVMQICLFFSARGSQLRLNKAMRLAAEAEAEADADADADRDSDADSDAGTADIAGEAATDVEREEAEPADALELSQAQLRRILDASQEDNESLRLKMRELNEEVSKLANDKIGLKEKYDKLENDHNDLQASHDKIYRQNKTLMQSSNKNDAKEQKMIRTHYAELDFKRKEFAAFQSRSEMEIKTFSQELDSCRQENLDLQYQIKECRKDTGRLQTQITEKSQALEEAHVNNKTLQTRIGELHVESMSKQEAHAEDLARQTDTHAGELAEKDQAIKEKTGAIAILTAHNVKVEEQLTQIRSMAKEGQAELKVKLDRLQNISGSFESQAAQYAKDLEDKQRVVDVLTSAASDYEVKQAELQNGLGALQAGVGTKNGPISKLENLLSLTSQSANNQRVTLAYQENTIYECQRTIADMQVLVDERDTKINGPQDQIDAMRLDDTESTSEQREKVACCRMSSEEQRSKQINKPIASIITASEPLALSVPPVEVAEIRQQQESAYLLTHGSEDQVYGLRLPAHNQVDQAKDVEIIEDSSTEAASMLPATQNEDNSDQQAQKAQQPVNDDHSSDVTAVLVLPDGVPAEATAAMTGLEEQPERKLSLRERGIKWTREEKKAYCERRIEEHWASLGIAPITGPKAM